MYCCYCGYDTALKILLKSGVDVNVQNFVLQTSLILASKCGQLKCVEILINSATNLDHVDMFDNTALHYAVMLGHEEVAQMLISAGAKTCKRNKKGLTPLMIASNAGQEAVIKLLKDDRAKLGIPQRSPFHQPSSPSITNGPEAIRKIVSRNEGQCNINGNEKPSPTRMPSNLNDLLSQIGLSKYSKIFMDQEVDLDVFATLTDSDLKEIGINLMGPRKIMIATIAKLKREVDVNQKSSKPHLEITNSENKEKCNAKNEHILLRSMIPIIGEGYKTCKELRYIILKLQSDPKLKDISELNSLNYLSQHLFESLTKIEAFISQNF